MAIYLVLITIPDQGKKSADDYADRLGEIGKIIDFLGVKVLSQYALLGPYDFVNLVDAPSDEIIAKMAIYLRSLVGVQTTTFTAIPVDSLLATLRKKELPF